MRYYSVICLVSAVSEVLDWESPFARTVDGNPLIGRAYQMVMAARIREMKKKAAEWSDTSQDMAGLMIRGPQAIYAGSI